MENKKNILINKFAREIYDLDLTPFTRLGSFESEIWEVYKNQIPYILRVTECSHRTIKELLSEASWIHFLHSHGCPVINVIQTNTGVDCFSIDELSVCLMLFTKAPGHGPIQEDLTCSLIEKWGTNLGRMHKLSLQYKPSKDFIRSYTENIFTSNFNKVAGVLDPFLQKKYSTLLAKCMEFPVSHKHYGLIHSDLHLGNFFVNNEEMTIFDFDDLQLGWFVFDLAIALYYIFWNSDLKENTWYQDSLKRSEQAIYFLQNLLKGYKKEFHLPVCWSEMMPVFLELRQFDLYLIFEKRFSSNTDTNSMPYILTQQYKQRILNQIPVVPLDVFDKNNYLF